MDWDTRNRHRLVWPTQVGGFLVSIGFLTGLANMAFFPSAICAQGHAGNFIAVYLICVVVIGFPLTYLHLCLGQYSGCNPTNVFSKLCPAFKGIGWSWLFLMIPMMIISNMNTAWSIYYMYVSGNAIITGNSLPWGFHAEAGMGGVELPSRLIDYVKIVNHNETSEFNKFVVRRPYVVQTTTPDYFHHLYHTSAPEVVMSVDEDNILRVVNKKINMGTVETRMVVSLALSWLIVCMCTMHNSVHTMNRVVYVTATLPLLILAILFARVIYLPGAWDGIKLLSPTIDRILEKSVWQSAIKLIFFDMQVGVGVLISISKHNRFHTNVFRDAVLMVTIDMVVSLLAACVAFGFLGFMAFKLEATDIRSMCRGQIAPHLLWDQILRSMTFLQPHEAPVFSFMYQLMLALGAIECTFTLCESFSSALDCRIPMFNERPYLLRGIVAVLLFFLTIPCCFQSGVHVYNLLVHYSMHWNLKVVALCQFAVIVFIYGVDNLFKDIALMLRLPDPEMQSRAMRLFGPTGAYIKHTWTWVCPSVIFIAIIFDLFVRESNHYQKRVGDSTFWHFLSVVSILPLPVFVIFYTYKKDKTAFQAKAWRALQMPYDDSTICNSLLNQEVELEDVQTSSDRRRDVVVPRKGSIDKYQSVPKSATVNFCVSNPYFDIKSSHFSSEATLPMTATTPPSFFPISATNTPDTNELTPMIMHSDEDDDEVDSDSLSTTSTESLKFQKKISSSEISVTDFGALTGQPSFFSSGFPSTMPTTTDMGPQQSLFLNQNNPEPPPGYESA